MHRIMPIILKKHGFNIDEYEETEEKKQGGLSAKEYKKKMEQEKEELNKKLEDMVKEYNDLACRVTIDVTPTTIQKRLNPIEC